MEPEMEDLQAKQSTGQAIRRLKHGDMGGLECLIDRYQQKALRTAFLVTHNEPMAEDVVQDAFVRFYERAGYFDESRPFEAYFMRSVINTALNLVEREKKGSCFTDGDTSELEELLEQAASIEEQVEFNTLKWQIAEVLTELPPRQRAVIVQRYYLEMSEQEMSEALDSPPGTVKWLLNAARARLRSLLGSERMAE
jgi:RNA polymerase sigma-70 factor (ECF subfamily)